LPTQIKLLFRVTALRLRAQSLGISKIDASAVTGKLSFAQQTKVDPRTIVQLVQQHSKVYKLTGPTQLQFTHNASSADAKLMFIEDMLHKLAPSS